MKKHTVSKALFVLLSMAALFLVSNVSTAAAPWPADPKGTLINVNAGYEPSGIVWHTRLGRFFIASDNGYIISMNADGGSAQYWNVGGDLEAVTIADPSSNYIYVGIENPDSIKEVDVTTGKFTGKSWDLTQWMTGPANSGLEALTFVPNSRTPYGPSTTSGGLFYAGLQADGKIYVFDVDLAHSGTVAFKNVVLTPASGKWDISDMFYSIDTNIIYAIFDSYDLMVELTPDGTILGNYALPLPAHGQEGIVVVTSPPDTSAQVYIAQDEAPEVWGYDNFPVSYVAELVIASGSGGTTDPQPGNYLYDLDETATVTADAAAGYDFTGWSGTVTGEDNPVRVIMDGNKSIKANFAQITYTLSVNATNGSVALSPPGGVYNVGTVVTLTATPAAGYKFNGWSGAITTMANPATVTMDGNRSVTANFVPITYTLGVSATNGNVALSPPGGVYNVGTVVTLTATPAAGYQFSGWSGAITTMANPATVTMDGNRSVTANFVPITYTLGVSATNGSVALSPPGGVYNSGTVVTLTATPAAGYQFSGWSGAISGTANPTTVTMDGNKSVVANFTVIPVTTYTLTTSAKNGSIVLTPPDGTYPAGTVVTLKAVPKNSWYKFTGWSGSLTGKTNPTTLTMNGNKSVTANFRFSLFGW
jgi:uncharacterized repeat protein (TIGR02543 family)